MEPQVVLSEFLEAWIKKDWDKVFSHCQKTWKEGKTAKDIESKLSRKPRGFAFVSHTNLGNIRQEINVKLSFSDGEVTINRAILICESAPFNPASYGDWGVNPVSILQVVEVISKPETKTKDESKKKGKV